MRTLDRKLLRDLRKIRSQAVAIGAVVAAGVSVSVLGLCNTATLTASQHDAYQRYRFADVFVSLKRAPASVAPRLAAISGVANVDTRIVVPAVVDMPDVPEPVSMRLVSLPVTHPPQLNDVAILAGRPLQPGRAEVLLSEPFAQAHGLTPGDSVTAILNNRRRSLQIAGLAFSPEFIYAVQPGTLFPNNRTFGVGWMEQRDLAAAFGLEGAFNDAVLQLTPGTRPEPVMEAIDGALTRYGGYGAYARADQPSHWVLEAELAELRTMGRLLPTIFSAVAAFLLHIVVSRVVAAQREQIGVLEAFGYTRLAIAAHYGKLVLVVTAAGVVVGVPTGIWLAAQLSSLYQQFFNFPALLFTVPALPIVMAAVAAMSVALLGSMLALRAVLQVTPAVALRPAAPQEFRPSFAERFGWHRFMTAWMRIVLRNIERRPLRVAAAVTSVSLAAAIMVLGRGGDALEYVMDVELSIAQRQSGTISFVDPKPRTTLTDLQHLPGVMDAEPFRTVRVRFISRGTVRRGALTGLPAAPRLARPLDARLRPVPIPAQGLVISAKLAELLHVAPGDHLEVETLEGARRTYRTLLISTIEDYVGTSAYMNLDALNRLMYEGDVISGAHLLIDPSREPALFTAVKQTPGVAALSLMRSVRRSFAETLQEAFALSLSFLIAIAGVIAFGVVFNTARTLLAEQAWELATLRVLGFTRHEVGKILLTQIGAIVFVAIPLGLWVGYLLAHVVSAAYSTDAYRFPVKILPVSYAVAAGTVLVATVLSAGVVWRLLGRLDFLSVLKARE